MTNQDESLDYLRFFQNGDNLNFLELCGANIVPGADSYFFPTEYVTENTVNQFGSKKIIKYSEFLAIIPENKYLEHIFDRMPFGIIDKRATGIGATTLELKAQRNSIIVVPTKSLAITKHLSPDFINCSLYVGSRLTVTEANGVKRTIQGTGPRKIREFLSNDSVQYKKFIVVADSLPKVLRVIGEVNYSNYFLMIDEVDVLQSDSTFRKSLPVVLDYYFKFPKKNRALVSATIREFSHPKLENETKIVIQQEDAPRRNIKTIHSYEIAVTVRNKIEEILENPEYRDQKIVIALNSLDAIWEVIMLLKQEYRNENICGILCSERSIKKAERYFTELVNGALNKKITFLTCAYFVGVDIQDSFHLISASSWKKIYTLLSPEKIIQIAGRCRKPHSLHSDTIIYDTSNSSASERINAKRYIQNTESKVDALLKLFQSADRLATNDTLKELFRNVKEAIAENVKEGIPGISGSSPLSLVRRNLDDVWEKSYLNMDALESTLELLCDVYSTPRQLPRLLLKGNDVTPLYLRRDQCQDQNLDQIRKTLEDRNDNLNMEAIQELADQLINGVSIRELISEGIERGTERFVQRFQLLSPYLETEQLIPKLLEFEEKTDERKYTNFRRAAIFWALAEGHPLKSSVFQEFPIGERFSQAQICEKLNNCINPYGYSFISHIEAVRMINNWLKFASNRHGGLKVASRTSKKMQNFVHRSFIPASTSPSEIARLLWHNHNFDIE